MVSQAFIDDSGSEGLSHMFVLGGFVSEHVRWSAFSNDWQSALDVAPSLDYFKMREAMAFRGQFDRNRGWNEALRRQRLGLFSEIIVEHVQARISTSVQTLLFRQYIQALPSPGGRTSSSDSPYSYLVTRAIIATIHYLYNRDLEYPCDFILDEQTGFTSGLEMWWDVFRHHLKEERDGTRRYIKNRPIWRDEKDFLPLQAADLYAWLVRRRHQDNRLLIMPSKHPFSLLERIPNIETTISIGELINLRKHLLHIGKRFREYNPHVPWIDMPRNRKDRRAARKLRVRLQPTFKTS